MLEALLQKYQDQGIIDLGDARVLQIPPFDAMGTPFQLIKQFGTRADFLTPSTNFSPLFTRGQASHVCSHHRQIDPGHHAPG